MDSPQPSASSSAATSTTLPPDQRSTRRHSQSTQDNHLNDPYYDQEPPDVDHPVTWDYSTQEKRTSHPQYQDDAYDEYDDYWEDDSPYPEVRAAVANTDDPTMPTNTFRMWFLGLLTTILIAGMNQFFYLRYPSVQITALVAQLIALPFGKLLERILPTRKFTTFGYRWSFNPGPWNIKEHTLVVVMANVVAGGAYATDIIAAQRTFYDQNWPVTYQLCLVISTQLLGFAFAGICRRFLVWPASMIWPATLVNAALFNTMHSRYLDDEDVEFVEDEIAPANRDWKSRLSDVWTRLSNRTSTSPSQPNTNPQHSDSTDKRSAVGVTVGSHPCRLKRKSNKRSSFFTKTLILATLWSVVPSYLFTALSTFTPLCWIFSTPRSSSAPPSESSLPQALGPASSPLASALASITPKRNIIINHLFGYTHGLGMGFLTFDWAMIAYNGSPLVTPWWAELNVFATLVIVFWIIAPVMYYKNVFFAHYLPISSSGSYDNTGRDYNSRRVVVDGVFRPDLYKNYSPLYIPVTFALSYGLSFGSLTATIVHTFLWYRQDIRRLFRSRLKDSAQEDIHARLMLAYPEVPQWWYASLGVGAFVLGVITCEVWDTKLPFWAYLLSIIIALVYLIPIGMIQAITNMQVGLNVITELIVGYALPGRPVAMMIFKTFGYITMAQALSFVSDLKLGHYMKVPPRLMFMTQTVAALTACFVVVGVQQWMFENIPGLCENDQPDKFTCPGVRVFSTASLIWGGIGPARAFNQGSLYYPTVFFFLIGAILPIPFYFLALKFPRSWFKYVNIPVCFTGMGNLPPATGINYSSWTLVGFIFQYWVRRHRFAWWSRFNYLLSAGLDSGVALATILVFFCLVYPKTGKIRLDWWGNTVNQRTPDHLGTPLKSVLPGEIFGPREWN